MRNNYDALLFGKSWLSFTEEVFSFLCDNRIDRIRIFRLLENGDTGCRGPWIPRARRSVGFGGSVLLSLERSESLDGSGDNPLEWGGTTAFNSDRIGWCPLSALRKTAREYSGTEAGPL